MTILKTYSNYLIFTEVAGVEKYLSGITVLVILFAMSLAITAYLIFMEM